MKRWQTATKLQESSKSSHMSTDPVLLRATCGETVADRNEVPVPPYIHTKYTALVLEPPVNNTLTELTEPNLWFTALPRGQNLLAGQTSGLHRPSHRLQA